jgi:hypothetical protein
MQFVYQKWNHRLSIMLQNRWVQYICARIFKQFLGLGTELEKGCRTCPPGYTLHSLAELVPWNRFWWAN